jgi:(4-(4-[2-(gamma-L-glutamylamino)ethyl]phenoxymethyl)furan-2-yl)methanamine synthase
MSWLAFDIGGANLKAADGRGWAKVVPFALWKYPDRLRSAMVALLEVAPLTQRIAVTMTGELCDCFATKADGVRHIVDAASAAGGSREVEVYLVDGRLVSIEQARDSPHLAAASNWHALARFACRFVSGKVGLLVDIGSTTTDVIPLVDGQPRPRGWNDTDRLLAGELVYTGVGRTPICAITRSLPWRGQLCPVAGELFATAADAYVVLDCIPEQLDATTTADGRPLSKEFARARLARMICADTSEFAAGDARQVAEHVQEAQLVELDEALRQVIEHLGRLPQSVVISGSGEFLANRLADRGELGQDIVSLGQRLGPAIAVSAAAHALAVLAHETLSQ